MSLTKKIIIYVISGILLVLLIFSGSVYIIARSSIPEYSGTVDVEGLENMVTISRDDRGVPYIKADTLKDLFFAQGYVHAQERLWQMEMYRRAHSGRISEVIGEDMLDMDIFTKTIGLARVTEDIIEKTSPDIIEIIESYVGGINAFLDTGKVPPELRLLGIKPDTWTVSDVMGTVVLVAYQLGMNWSDELIRVALQEGLDQVLFEDILPPYDDWETMPVWNAKEAGFTIDTEDINFLWNTIDYNEKLPLPKLGSNSWVVSPELSESGFAMLANDPHMDLSLPNVLYENQLQIDENLFIYGWSIPGGPGVIIGHNSHISWGITNIGDAMDLFFEKRDSDNPYLFLKDDEWYEAEIIKEQILVKGKDPVEIEIIITKNGPLISEDPPLSLCWAGYDIQDSTADAIMEINLARNWDEFKEGLYKFSTPITNMVYADTDGNIGFRTAGQLPIRKSGTGVFPNPGWDSSYEWQGYIPMEELPELFNPPSGFIVTANHKVNDDDYPYVISHDYAPPYRMERIVEMLQEKDKYSLDDFKIMQNDWYNLHAYRRLKTWLADMAQFEEVLNPNEKKALELLNDWAPFPVNSPEKSAPAIFQVWYLNCMEDVFREEMGDDLYKNFISSAYLAYNAFESILEKENSPWLENGISSNLMESFKKTVKDLTVSMGNDPDNWQWQKLQTVTLEHLVGEVDLLGRIFNRGPYPYGGDHMTVGRAGYKLYDPFHVNFGASMRYIILMNQNKEAYTVMGGGQSGHFLSSHYDDQVEKWRDGDLYPINSTIESLETENISELILMPR